MTSFRRDKNAACSNSGVFASARHVSQPELRRRKSAATERKYTVGSFIHSIIRAYEAIYLSVCVTIFFSVSSHPTGARLVFLLTFEPLSASTKPISCIANTSSGSDISSPGYAPAASLTVESDDKGVLVIGIPEGGSPCVRMADDIAQVWLSQLLQYSRENRLKSPISEAIAAFWRSIDIIARSGTKREEDLQLSQQRYRLKYFCTNGEITVIVTAKKLIDNQIHPRIPRELNHLVNVIEDDVIGKILGMEQLCTCLCEIKSRGSHTIFAVSPNLARFSRYPHPRDMRGLTRTDLNATAEESAMIYDQVYSNMDPQTKSSIVSVHVPRFPGFCFLLAIRQILPGIHIVLAIIQDQRATVGPKLPTVPSLLSYQTWKRNGWDEVLENCIHYIAQNKDYASRTRLKLPEKFLEDMQSVYCYAYMNEKGENFLPSGSSDGFWWKSSRGVVSAGDTKRKYHYVNLPDGKKLRRRVMWNENVKGLYIVEYRHFDNINTDADKLMGPECMDWPRLLNEVHSTNQQLSASLERISAHFDMAETRVNTAELGTENVESTNIIIVAGHHRIIRVALNGGKGFRMQVENVVFVRITIEKSDSFSCVTNVDANSCISTMTLQKALASLFIFSRIVCVDINSERDLVGYYYNTGVTT
ncbi:hypothetical protein PROFUN_11830 [Planoprotostelium fungivorum]|uniref:Uncharacterized protein n=1 Tax=Planoprotostelium fungivorum TaxID=1890364 RepID=A0A2P6N979_9EUKA|nr:hypothetical protein PROFUN_11830 [Planoprotostelium fungivorum]